MIRVLLVCGVLVASGAQAWAAEDPLPVKVVQPVPSNDSTLAAVWMAAISGVLALGSAALQAYTSRRSAADRLQYDADLTKLKAINELMQAETRHCEERAANLEKELKDVRERLAVAEAEIKRLKGGA